MGLKVVQEVLSSVLTVYVVGFAVADLLTVTVDGGLSLEIAERSR